VLLHDAKLLRHAKVVVNVAVRLNVADRGAAATVVTVATRSANPFQTMRKK